MSTNNPQQLPSPSSSSTTTTTTPEPSTIDRSNIINVNVGVLGHVDSGKTSLVKALSTLLSTAALDKNPQSQQRGITLDLGFSAFTLPMPEHLQASAGMGKDLLQFTLVDCPGHASLIRTIIGGAQIIDMVILVIDANKGIQTQTAECIVIGEITTDKLIVVLNKVDMLPEEERDVRIQRISNRIRRVFAATKFADAPIVATAAAVGGEKVASIGAATAAMKDNKDSKKDKGLSLCMTMGVNELVDLIRHTIVIPQRNITGPFYYAIDHCFAIKGHGTVLTGTVLSGSISLNTTIELPELQQQRKIKGMQMFRKAVRHAVQGDRVALCVTNLDPKLIERGIAVTPGSIPLLSTVICMVKKVRFFRRACKSNSKFHVSIGHMTVVATVLFYGANEIATLLATTAKSEATATSASTNKSSSTIVTTTTSTGNSNNGTKKSTSTTRGSHHNHHAITACDRQTALNATYLNGFPSLEYPWEGEGSDFEYQEVLRGNANIIGGVGTDTTDNSATLANTTENGSHSGSSNSGNERRNMTYGREPVQWAVLQFQQPVYCPLGSLVIGSRLDAFETNLDKEISSGSGGNTSGSDYSASEGGAAGVGGDRERTTASRCRLAFYGPVREMVPPPSSSTETGLEKIRIFHWKQKEAVVFKLTDVRAGNCFELIGWQLVKEGGCIDPFVGMKVDTDRGQIGVRVSVGSKLTLRFKRFVHDKEKTMCQTGVEEKALAVAALNAGMALTGGKTPTAKGSNSTAPRPKKIDEGGISSTSFTSASSSSSTVLGKDDGLPSDVTIPPTPPKPSSIPHTLIPSAAATTAAASSSSVANIVTQSSTAVSTPTPPTPPPPTPSKVVPVSGSSPGPVASLSPVLGPIAVGTLRRGVIESVKLETTSESESSSTSTPTPVSSSSSSWIVIVTGAFRMEENIRKFGGVPVKVILSQGSDNSTMPQGTLIGPFAKMGKVKIRFESTCMVAVGDVVEIDISGTSV